MIFVSSNSKFKREPTRVPTAFDAYGETSISTDPSVNPCSSVMRLSFSNVSAGISPIEQIHGTTASFIVPMPSGVQTVFTTGASAAVTEQAAYSVFGVQTDQAGSNVTPFGFDGSYRLPNDLVYLINRYYDPTTSQFLSVDPDLAVTGQPYAFTGDNPLNATDPLGNVIRCGGQDSAVPCGSPGSGIIVGPSGAQGCSQNCQGAPGWSSGENYYAGPPPSVLAAAENAAIGKGWLVGAIVNAQNAKNGREEIEITEIKVGEKDQYQTYDHAAYDLSWSNQNPYGYHDRGSLTVGDILTQQAPTSDNNYFATAVGAAANCSVGGAWGAVVGVEFGGVGAPVGAVIGRAITAVNTFYGNVFDGAPQPSDLDGGQEYVTVPVP